MSKDDLKDKIQQWLSEQGYPLEMEVARALQSNGFTVRQSDCYRDFETNQYREIDVTAFRNSNTKRPVILHVRFQIECKASPKHPWILFVSNGSELPYMPSNVISSSFGRTYFWQDMDLIYRLPILAHRNVGYGLTEAFTNKVDVTYKALQSTVKSCIDTALDCEQRVVLDHRQFKQFSTILVFPIIVVDGTLIECSMSDAGDVQLQEVDKGVILWKSENPTKTLPLVMVYTKRAIPQLAREAQATADALTTHVESSNEAMNLYAAQYLRNEGRHSI